MSTTLTPVVLVPVMYRDADNYKEHATLFLKGTVTDALKNRLRRTLEDQQYYLPTQVGQQHLGSTLSRWPDESSDHPWHELDVDEIEQAFLTPEQLERAIVEPMSFIAFIKIMEHNKALGWDSPSAEQHLGIISQTSPEVVLVTAEQASAWAGRPMDEQDLERLRRSIPNSSIPDAIGEIVAGWADR